MHLKDTRKLYCYCRGHGVRYFTRYTTECNENGQVGKWLQKRNIAHELMQKKINRSLQNPSLIHKTHNGKSLRSRQFVGREIW